MRTVTIFLIISIFALYFISAQDQNKACGTEKLQLPNKNYNLSLPVADTSFTGQTDCTIEVASYNKMKFQLSIPAIQFHDSANCAKNYIAVSEKKETLQNGQIEKMCDEQSIKKAKIPETTTLFIRVVTTDVGKPPSVIFNFKSTQGPECGEAVIQLEKAFQSVSLPPATHHFSKDSDCDIQVKGFDGKNFKMWIPDIMLNDDTCVQSYVAASADLATIDKTDYKYCGTKPILKTIESQSSTLNIKIVTKKGTEATKVTFAFQTIFPECGASEIQLDQQSQDITLPAAGHRFTPKTECFLKVSGKNNTDFNLTITEINFHTPCDNDYVTAADKMEALPNKDYKHCGTAAVTTPFSSKNGVMYIQTKTVNANQQTSVKLHFQSNSGASVTGKYILGLFVLFNMMSATVF